MPAWSGVRSALRLLQPMHANTQFSQVEVPPCDRGVTWSIVNSSPPGWQPQYWQAQWSPFKILWRLKLTAGGGKRSYLASTITPGRRSRSRTAWMNHTPSVLQVTKSCGGKDRTCEVA